jgi:hypothetical protein
MPEPDHAPDDDRDPSEHEQAPDGDDRDPSEHEPAPDGDDRDPSQHEPAPDGDDRDPSEDEPLPDPVVEAAERLTRLARQVVDDAEADAYRDDRDDLLDEHDYTARVREDDSGETLVCHPDEWLEDGVVRTDRIDDVDDAVEVSLSGTGSGDDWESVDAHNRSLVDEVRAAHGDVHAANVDLLADFASNHYAKEIESLAAAELAEFRADYYTRNCWPASEEKSVIDESIELAFEVAGVQAPRWR